MSVTHSPSSGRSALVDAEFVLTGDDFNRIARILHEDSGIHLTVGKAALVYSRLARRLRLLGLSSFRDYCSLLAGASGADERRAMLSALTTNLTRFFREPHHFEHLHNLLLQRLKPEADKGGRIRIWSAGCSTGEEPYSIAMAVLDVMPNAAARDVRILATDIDPSVIATAEQGRYPAEAAKQVPVAMRRHLTGKGDIVDVSDDVRELISFRELNLMADWPMRGKFDVIFCRNVAIYFEEETQNRLWSRFADRLTSRGILYAGHSERVSEPRFKSDGLTTYALCGSTS